MNASVRVLVRSEPATYEDMSGFLMRVAAANWLYGPSSILTTIAGSPNAVVEQRHLLALADYCRNTPQEIVQLSGYERRDGGGTRVWHIAGEWVTKRNFISMRSIKICPRCLEERPYLDGLWALTHYVVCARHAIYLVSECVACRRPLRWNRSHPCRCSCGFDLRGSDLTPAPPASLLLARLIAHRSCADVSLALCQTLIPNEALEKLARLSLDGLLKTIWFLGHFLGNYETVALGHGRHLPTTFEVESTAQKAFGLLAGWPGSLADALLKMKGHGRRSGPLNTLWLEPLEYWQQELDGGDLTIWRTAYEWYVRKLWYALGGQRPRSSDRQLDLDLGGD